MEIRFKVTRRKHSSGYSILEKTGDLKFDQDKHAKDGIWLYVRGGGRVFIDRNYKTKEFRITFDEKDFKESLF